MIMWWYVISVLLHEQNYARDVGLQSKWRTHLALTQEDRRQKASNEMFSTPNDNAINLIVEFYYYPIILSCS